MEPIGSLQCLQEPATGSYAEPDDFNPYTQTLFLQDPSMLRSTEWFLSFKLSDQI
jgi:hypothetical protein